MDINQIASKEDIQRLESALQELKNQLYNLISKPTITSPYLSSKQVMELLNVKEWALRQMRIAGTIKYVEFGKWKRYPADQFLIKTKNKTDKLWQQHQ